MSHATKTVVYEVTMEQYITHVEEYPGKQERFFTQWENTSRTLLAETGEEDVAVVLGEKLAHQFDADRTLAVWAHGNCKCLTIRVIKVINGLVPQVILRLSVCGDRAVGEVFRTPTAPGTEVPDCESVLLF